MEKIGLQFVTTSSVPDVGGEVGLAESSTLIITSSLSFCL